MAETPIVPARLTERDRAAILFANDAFYAAFSARDFDQMRSIWAEGEGVGCIHPGWPPLYGRETVLESWRRILENPETPAVSARAPRVVPQGPDGAAVICYEDIGGQLLIATNSFVREGDKATGGTWKLCHHHASAVPPPGELPDEAGSQGMQ